MTPLDLMPFFEEAFEIPGQLLTKQKNFLYKSKKKPLQEDFPFPTNLSKVKEPQLYNGNLGETIFLLPLEENFLILGPIVFSSSAPTDILQNLERKDFPLLKDYYLTIPIFSTRRLLAIGKVVLEFFQLPYPFSQLKKLFTSQKKVASQKDKLPPVLNTPMEAKETKSYIMEQYFYRAIAKGDSKEVLKRLQTFYQEGALGVLAGDALRNEKNLGISGITLMTRSAIEGGLESPLAYEMSDNFIRQLEASYSVGKVDQIIINAAVSFTDKVKAIKYYAHHTPLVSKTLRFLHENPQLKISEIAEKIGVTPPYLSRLFKKELQTSFSQYKMGLLLEESREYLKFTSKNLAEIAFELGFTDASYFSKNFKARYHQTPAEFRKKQQMNKVL